MGKNAVEKGAGFMADPFGGGAAFSQAVSGGGPEKSYVGGSQETYANIVNAYRGQGAVADQAGQTLVGQGAGTLGTAGQQSQADRGNAYALYNRGTQLGGMGIDSQNSALQRLEAQAYNQGPSQAQAMMRGAQDENSRRMMGAASSARGGNQAAALRNAQAMGSQNALVTNQQLGSLRAQEEAQRQQNILGAQQYAAQAYGQQAGLGYGMAGQGLGAAQQSTGQLAGIGANQTSAGLGQQNVGLGYYGLLNDMNKTQFEGDRANASATAASRNPGGMLGGVVGGIMSVI